MNIAIITARGGSKRLPRKNIRDFLGKPIIAYPIEAARNCGIFDEVMVSTDSEEIAAIAMKHGASVPFMRSDKASDDYTSSADVLLEVIDNYEKLGKSFEWICCIYPTAPLITANKLNEAFKLVQKQNADALIPIVEFSFPPLRGLIIEDELLKIKWTKYYYNRSQDLEPIYHDTGQFYFVRTETFIEEKVLLCKNTVPMVLSELEVQDIDNESDWKMAELKYQFITKRQNDKHN